MECYLVGGIHTPGGGQLFLGGSVRGGGGGGKGGGGRGGGGKGGGGTLLPRKMCPADNVF